MISTFISTETLVIELLLIVSLVAIAVRRLRIPYTVALVVVGLLLTTQQPAQVDLTPELILACSCRRWSSRPPSTSTSASCGATCPASCCWPYRA